MWREVDVVYSHGSRKMKRIKTLIKNIIKNSEPNARENLVQNWFFF
jgi:hypothetical protein